MDWPENVKGYEAYMEGRVLELGSKEGQAEFAQQWKAIRRGWYLGNAVFKERMLSLVEGPLRQGRRGSYSGEAKREYGEAEAELLLAKGLTVLGLEEGLLAGLPKGGMEKQVLAWWLCQHTTASRRWVSERLNRESDRRSDTFGEHRT